MSRAAALTALALILLVAACGERADASTVEVSRCEARIAVFGPLSGAAANLGRNIEHGVRLALNQYNAAHPACTVELAAFDTLADPKRAPAAAQEVVSDPRILGVVGPAFSGESEAAVPLLDQAKIASITPSATEASLSTRGWTTFHRLIGNDAEQGPAAGRYIAGVLRASKVFVIDDTGAYGHGLASEVMGVLGERVVESGTVLPAQEDLTAVVTRIRAADPDVIFFGGYYDEAGRLLRQVRAAGVTAPFVAGDGVKDEGFLHTAGQRAAQDAIITCPCRPPETLPATFIQQYQAEFGGLEPGTNSAEAYDAATVFLNGIGSNHLSRSSMAAYVSAYDQPGITTRIAFTPSGELTASSITVWAYRVRDTQILGERPIP
ncbi:branched-chain amino acid ABC transporter substrate-binding protein [Micromonospora sp. WMMD1155]|uniref:branched-chain amino acid ABC transporter substrate-binding protein n=1 Tax=Micromonospora sp. WMMD1155 TaxID=3016094 RepID=UPI00249C0674|nr:branched-chain amino acid ABC transporter substrate-binding protein [Micromonospora sp. WMMD1155]WFE48804.1 branched-chain amino acid ABC transporter substrate-binding protein [Micromonospora sp. WMMD1155]WFE54956.1 branched-chain amino acid ABC transporter substrate-binding protein [Micromonospora sp. WMMD1155]